MVSTASSSPTYDVLIVGTGFAGVYLLHKLRKLNFSVIAVDASSSLGGVWCQNTYPGCRVDIEVPTYSLAIDDLLNTPDSKDRWVWSERFPGNEELKRYFQFVDRKLGGLSQHCVFDTWVERATWDEQEKLWEVEASGGKKWKAKFLLPCVGYAAKPNIPDWDGLDSFKGVKAHTGKWPEEGIDIRGKRVGVIGTGASGVGVIQAIAKDVKELVGTILVFSCFCVFSVLSVTNYFSSYRPSSNKRPVPPSLWFSVHSPPTPKPDRSPTGTLLTPTATPSLTALPLP